MKEATIKELVQLDREIRGEVLVKGFDIEFWTGQVIATSKTDDGFKADKIFEKEIMKKGFKCKIKMLEKILTEKYNYNFKKFPLIITQIHEIRHERDKFAHSRPMIPISSNMHTPRKKNQVWITHYYKGKKTELIVKPEHEKKMKKWDLIQKDLLYILTDVQEKNGHFKNAA